MTNHTDHLVFKTPQQGKTVMAIYMIVFTIITMIIAVLMGLGVFSIILVLCGIFGYASSLSEITLTDDALIVSSPLGKGVKYPLDSGTFSIQKITGFQARASYFKPEADSIIYQKNDSKDAPVIVMNGVYDPNDVKSLYAEIEKRQKALA